jgi:single-strand DNA-binding protein
MSFRVFPSGNLVTDPELRYSKEGKAFCTFRIAVDNKDKPTTYKNCICFAYLAENLGASMLKGDRVMIAGRMETQEWKSKEGKDMTTDQIIVEDAGPSLMFAEAEYKRKSKEGYEGDNSGGVDLLRDAPLE